MGTGAIDVKTSGVSPFPDGYRQPGPLRKALNLTFDPDAVRRRYDDERDPRLRQSDRRYRRIEGVLGKFFEDPTPIVKRGPITEDVDVVVCRRTGTPRHNSPPDPRWWRQLQPGWQRRRMIDFIAVVEQGRPPSEPIDKLGFADLAASPGRITAQLSVAAARAGLELSTEEILELANSCRWCSNLGAERSSDGQPYSEQAWNSRTVGSRFIA